MSTTHYQMQFLCFYRLIHSRSQKQKSCYITISQSLMVGRESIETDCNSLRSIDWWAGWKHRERERESISRLMRLVTRKRTSGRPECSTWENFSLWSLEYLLRALKRELALYIRDKLWLSRWSQDHNDKTYILAVNVKLIRNYAAKRQSKVIHWS